MNNKSIIEDISSILESQFFITCRWLACNYEISLDEATDILNNYDISKDSGLTKTYILSGLSKSDVYCFIHVNENDIETAKSDFKEDFSQSIYSLQRHASESTPFQLTSLDTEQAKSILSDPNATNHFLLNQMGSHVIQSSTIKLHPMGMRLRSATASAANHQQSSSSSSSSSFNNNGDKDDLRLSSKSSMDAKSSLFPKPLAKKDNAPVKAPSAVVSNFFGKSNTTDNTTGTSTSALSFNHTKTDMVASTSATTLKRKSNSLVIDDDEEDESWNDGTGTDIKVDKNLLKTIATSVNNNTEYSRVSKRLVVEDDDQDGEEETAGGKDNKKGVTSKKSKKATAKASLTVNDDSEDKNGKTDPSQTAGDEDDDNNNKSSSSSTTDKPTKKASKTLLRRGAMDDYFEDLEIEKEKERLAVIAAADSGNGDTTSTSANSVPAKNTKRKLVEKMFADDRGYLVTQMVWEEVEINEGEVDNEEEEDDDDENNNNNKKKKMAKEKENDKNSMIPTPPADDNKPSKSAKPVAATAKLSAGGGKGKAAAASNTGQQKSMMSFFGKK